MAFLDKKIRLPLSRRSARVKDTRLSNQFGKSEWSGALGDLGTMLPLAYALIVFNGFSPERLFLLWGTVYLITGWYFKVPVSVQPLKVMSVVAIAQGVSVEMLAGTAVFYGLLLLALSLTGAIGWLQKWFTPTLVKGIQLGIGLILARKAVDLVVSKGFILNAPGGTTPINLLLMGGLVLILFLFRFRKKIPISIVLVSGGILLTFSLGFRVPQMAGENLISPALPQPAFFLDALVLLIIPQLPLTLGNAVYAASDACHSLWGAQAARVTPKKLGVSIGLGDVGIGLLG
ncbi:MAG TPA: hypothetical protein ENK44_17030, partial [Caldithrix abyssi]|nr:hypothetical protein [Caldithrix abyssi]